MDFFSLSLWLLPLRYIKVKTLSASHRKKVYYNINTHRRGDNNRAWGEKLAVSRKSIKLQKQRQHKHKNLPKAVNELMDAPSSMVNCKVMHKNSYFE
jgi:hypothetical protein